MRFLLLCPAVLLLLTSPAKTVPTDAVESPTSPPNNTSTTEPVITEPTDTSPSPATTTPSASPESQSVSPSAEPSVEGTSAKPDQPEPKEVRKLRRRLAKAQAELQALHEENESLENTLKTARDKMTQLVNKRKSLAGELQTTRRKLREAQDKLNTEVPVGQCEPSESEFAKLLAQEIKTQWDERREQIEYSYKNKFNNLLKELRLKVRKELLLVFDAPKTHRPFNPYMD